MSKPFYVRLKEYYSNVGKVLNGQADVSSIFPNTTDIGMTRESIYAEFLRQHTPPKCNVFLGGFLFDSDGKESKQIDIIVSTDTAPRYNLLNPDGKGKSFGHVEGCIAVVSIKSSLDKAQLFDSLEGIASIPLVQPLGNRINPKLNLSEFNEYEDWPFKIIYASDGLKSETIIDHINDFYLCNSNIPIGRRPNIIHVGGKYVIFKGKKGANIIEGDKKRLPEIGKYYSFNENPDIQAFVWILDEIQTNATMSSQILYDYRHMINRVLDIK